MSNRYGKLTQEDMAILWLRLTRRGAANLALESQRSDRRDDRAMQARERSRKIGAAPPARYWVL